MMSSKIQHVLLAAALLAAFPHGASAALTRVGAAGGVSGRVLAMAPESGEGVQAGVGRILSSGKTVYSNDKISTDAKGRLQVMLLDETVFTIGPNSEMYIDEFVYDPANAVNNKVTARVSKGVFRFVTGKVAAKEPTAMKVKLPVATIGIRGTIAGGYVGEGGTLVALLGPGAGNNAGANPGAIIVSGANTQEIYSPNNGVNIDQDQNVSDPAPLTEQQQQQLDTSPPPSDDGSGGGDAPPQSGGDGGGGEEGGGDAGAGEGGGGTEGSAGEDAGMDSADTQSSGAETDMDNSDLGDFQTETNTASQEAAAALADGIAQWADVRTVQSGQGYFYGTGDYLCLGLCGGGQIPAGMSSATGTAEFKLVVDFGARTVGGSPDIYNNSYISLSGAGAGGESGSDMIDVGALAFSALDGLAAITLGSGLGSNGGDFAGTTISLVNSGGQAAHHARLNLIYTTEVDALTTPTPIDSGTLQPLETGFGGGQLVGGL